MRRDIFKRFLAIEAETIHLNRELWKALNDLVCSTYEAGLAGVSGDFITDAMEEWRSMNTWDPISQESGNRAFSVLRKVYEKGRKEAAQCPHTS